MTIYSACAAPCYADPLLWAVHHSQDSAWCMLVLAGVRWYVWMYAGVCWYVLVYAGMSWCMLMYAGVCSSCQR